MAQIEKLVGTAYLIYMPRTGRLDFGSLSNGRQVIRYRIVPHFSTKAIRRFAVQFSVGFFSTCSMMSVSIGAFRESSFRPSFSTALKTALPEGSDAFPAGASVLGAAVAGRLKGVAQTQTLSPMEQAYS